MKLLADEHIASEIVMWLRSRGEDLLALARRDRRVILTRDLDFGELVYRDRSAPVPVILLRLHPLHPGHRLQVLQRAWPEIERHVAGNFLVVTPLRVRIRPLGLPKDQ